MDQRQPATVLIAEDQDDIAEAIDVILSDAGYVLIRARDGVEALTAARRARPDLLLLDVSMPRVDGFSVLRQLRNEGNLVPVIVMSAFRDFVADALKLGASATLVKPFDLDALLGTVRRVAKTTATTPEPPVHVVSPPATQLPCDVRLRPEDTPGEQEVLASQEEIGRLKRIGELRLTSPERDRVLDCIVALTAELLRAPIALISIVTETQQWWKAMYGLPPALALERGTPRSLSFCTHAVAARAPLIVGNASEHPFFKANELVRRGTLDAYAGVPIVIPDVGALGTLCALDTRPHEFTALDLELLSLLATRVAAEIAWRERHDRQPHGAFQFFTTRDETFGIYNVDAFASFTGVLARLALTRDCAFGIGAFRVARGTPSEGRDALVEAVQRNTKPDDILGWLDTDTAAVTTTLADPTYLRSVVSGVTRSYAEHREPREIRATCHIEKGALTSDRIIRQVRAELREH